MNKYYVIALGCKYVRLWEDERRIELVDSVKDATIYDSEEFAFESMLENKKAFYTENTLFYRIECIVVVYGY